MPRLDFQKIAEEREDFTIVLVNGEEITLPKVVPANKLLKLLANRSPQQLNELPAEEKNDFGNQMLEAIVGKENWQKILDGIGVDNVRPFTEQVYEYYGLGQQGTDQLQEGEEGKVEEARASEAPDPSQLRRSSTTSEPSTLTSNGSTPGLRKSSTGEPSTGTYSSPELDTSPESPSS